MRFYMSVTVAPKNTDLYGGFRQPGHSDEDFLLEIKSSKMNEQECD